jgi:arsenate reductase
MAEGFLKSFNESLDVYSAGTKPEKLVNPIAIKVMNEIGIDLSKAYTKNVSKYINHSFDYVITVCDSAKETCPVFTGKIKNRLHISFKDPAAARGNNEEVMQFYRKVRDEIKEKFYQLYLDNLK